MHTSVLRALRVSLPAFALAFSSSACAQTPPLSRPMSAADWQHDLNVLARELSTRHANAFHTQSRAGFDERVGLVRTLLHDASVDAAVVALAGVAASIGDLHTRLRVPQGWPRTAVVLRWFGCDDRSPGPCELRIIAAAPDHEDLLGARVLSIEGMAVADAHERVRGLIPQGESEGAVWAASGTLLQFPNLLHGLGIAPDAGSLSVSVIDAHGVTRGADVATVPRTSPIGSWRTAALEPAPTAERPGQPVWWTILSDSQTVFFAFDEYPGGRAMARLTTELIAFVNANRASRLIIDLRRNAGGDFTKMRETLLPALATHPVLQERGRVYVLIGPGTYSAAMTNAVDLRNRVAAVLVGLPTGSRPNGYQEGREFRLPRSGLTVGYSTKYYAFQSEDTPGVIPDQRIEQTWADFRAGRDAAVEWVLVQPR